MYAIRSYYGLDAVEKMDRTLATLDDLITGQRGNLEETAASTSARSSSSSRTRRA